ncbi:MAG: hypothetical protein HC908_13645 [Calothrix sp. SM1_7_51]|nr:hypothetical protein [Calothrix sp. SM1_7_51]
MRLHLNNLSQNLSQNLSKYTTLAATSLILIVGIYGCNQKEKAGVTLEIKSVQTGDSNGVYNISGSTNLPESSKIAVTAVRYLRPPEGLPGVLNSDANTYRSILGRQIVEVKQGQWQAQVDIVQVASDGTLQEAWQANQAQTKLTPDSDVTFIAAYDPSAQWRMSLTGNQNQDKNKEKENNPDIPSVEGKSVRFTNEGERYVQASKSENISLPNGKTTPPRPQPDELNGGWGNRYQIPPAPFVTTAILAPSKSSQTNAPANLSEYLR